MKPLFLTLALGAAMAASAQISDSTYVHENMRIHLTRTSPEVKQTLEQTRPVEPQSVAVPSFVIKSTDNKFIMAIGGHVNPIVGYDIGNNLYEVDGAGLGFVTSAIPVPAVKGDKCDYFINPLNAQLDFQIVGFAGTANAITAYIKFGTNNASNGVRLKRAYISYRGFTAGEVATLMEDGDAYQPPTIDPQGPCGAVATTAYEINYKSPDYNGFRWAIGLDMPSYYASSGYYQGHDFPQYRGEQVASVQNVEQMMPDIPAWIQYGTASGNRIRLSAMLRNFTYRDLLQDKVRHIAGYGVMLSGNLVPCKAVTLYLQAAYGRGFGAYLQDIAGQPLSFVPSDTRPGRMQASPMMGINIGASFNFAKRWQINLVGSESRIWNVSEYCTVKDAPANYKYALYGAANVFYNITSYLQWGLEYVWGRRVTWDIGGANDSRIQTQIMFTI